MANKKQQDIDLGLTRTDNNRPTRAVLTIETDKSWRGGLDCEGKVMWHGEGFRTCMLGIGAGGDFSKTIAHNKTARATQKAIDTLHAQTFTPEVIASLTAEAIAHYAEGKDKA